MNRNYIFLNRGKLGFVGKSGLTRQLGYVSYVHRSSTGRLAQQDLGENCHSTKVGVVRRTGVLLFDPWMQSISSVHAGSEQNSFAACTPALILCGVCSRASHGTLSHPPACGSFPIHRPATLTTATGRPVSRDAMSVHPTRRGKRYVLLKY
ncbi:hypothetical protein N657DRAFT_269895 [Parathielavia appendiculata]|uniref:Uncharacterized protein n=1 Tax=Parathielavia appendiculata TaxID=2587402 RepID=A0AAN6U3K9_9PEZI|nr:hypothetical protein N657DRAFT_269895 [Parathielavia appendiculata]